MEPRVRLKRTYDYTYVQYKTGWFWHYEKHGGESGRTYKMRWTPLNYESTLYAKRLLTQLKKEAVQKVERKAFRVVYEEITE
jgi:hypothetical protein